MKLLLHRARRPGVFHNVIYILDVRAQLSAEEYAAIVEHGLARLRLYQRAELADRGRGLLGVLFRLTFGAANLTIRVRDLIDGKRIETGSLIEALSIEDQVSDAARAFSQLVGAAVNYDGDQVVEL